jgi:pyridoxine/pyridoxamine 5'-phosphate oxidase
VASLRTLGTPALALALYILAQLHRRGVTATALLLVLLYKERYYMIYTQLSDSYKYDTLADAMYAREVEYFHYDFDRKNFEYLLANATDNEFAANVAERLNDTRKQMGNVGAIMAALKDQIEDQAAYDAAVVRVTAKREAKEAE